MKIFNIIFNLQIDFNLRVCAFNSCNKTQDMPDKNNSEYRKRF
jgi:hypothetical protein